ncbi:MAG: tetratricopeptide repeat protein [Deltaproteobacteria bacterium]|nr:tetratricopeptide repeat protein [Deltaproteobacteria bacterium]
MRVRAASVVISVVGLISLAGCSKSAVDAQKLAKHAQSIQGEDPKLASEEFKQAAGLDPSNHKILHALGTLYEKQKDWQNAAETYAKAAAVDENFASYHFRRGHALYELARKDPGHQGFDKAIDPLKKAAAKDANLSDAYYYLGKAYYETDEEQSALEAYTKAIDTRSDQLAYYVDLANLYLDLGFAEEGLKVATEGQKMAPNVRFADENEKAEGANNLYNLVLDEARAYEFLGKRDEKIAALKKARNVPNPKNVARESEYQLAIALYDKGEAIEACDALRNYLKSPAGKTMESVENRKDADRKKFDWGRSGGGCAGL